MPQDLELLQGVWSIRSLDTEGQSMPAAMLADARITVKGDRFVSTGMGAEYAGKIELDPLQSPRQIDMKFDAGPEAGNTNRGIYELDGDTWRICLATRGTVRPADFSAAPGSGFALETLVRGEAPAPAKARTRKKAAPATAKGDTGQVTEFEGEWPMISGTMSGKPMDESMVKWVKRVTHGNQTKVQAGPQVMMHVEFTHDSTQSPKTIDYVNLAGTNKGKTQYGIYEFEGDVLKVCVSAPGAPRPSEFESVPADGRTLTVWQRG
jgi:uncharacterized protein (TIGR03067 family)